MITLKDNFKGLVKPSGKLVLNRKNQFARNLSTAIFDIPSMQDQQGAAYAVTHPEVIPNVDEHGAYFSKIADSGDSFVSWPNNTPKITGNDPRTVIIIHKTVTASQNGRILTYGTNATGQRDTFRYDTGGDLRIEVSGGSFTTSINPTLDIHVSGFKFQGTQLAGYSVFSDGVIENATGTTTINTGTDAWAMLGDPFSGGAGRGVTDQIYGRFTWNRALSDAEIVEFCKNPWQLLRRVPTRVVFPETGPAGVTGTVNDTSEDDTSVASGVVTESITGTVSDTSEDDTSVASGVVTENITGTVVDTSDNDTSVASGLVSYIGTVNDTSEDDTSVASGVVGFFVFGTVDDTSEDDTSVASGLVSINVIGTVNDTCDDDTSVASGIVIESVTGTVVDTSEDDTSVASGIVASSITGTVVDTSDDDTAVAFGVVGADSEDLTSFILSAISPGPEAALSPISASEDAVISEIEGDVGIMSVITSSDSAINSEMS